MDTLVLPRALLRHAVVSYNRVGHDQDLRAKRGIGQRLWIADHAGAKDDLASRWSIVAKRYAFKNRPILQYQFALAWRNAAHYCFKRGSFLNKYVSLCHVILSS